MEEIELQRFRGKFSPVVPEISCNFKEFNAKNPGVASNKDDIVLDYTLGDDGYSCVVHIDGAHAVSANYKYSGVAENSFGEVKYTIESSVGEVSFEQPSFVLNSKHFQKNYALFNEISRQ